MPSFDNEILPWKCGWQLLRKSNNTHPKIQNIILYIYGKTYNEKLFM